LVLVLEDDDDALATALGGVGVIVFSIAIVSAVFGIAVTTVAAVSASRSDGGAEDSFAAAMLDDAFEGTWNDLVARNGFLPRLSFSPDNADVFVWSAKSPLLNDLDFFRLGLLLFLSFFLRFFLTSCSPASLLPAVLYSDMSGNDENDFDTASFVLRKERLDLGFFGFLAPSSLRSFFDDFFVFFFDFFFLRRLEESVDPRLNDEDDDGF